MLANHLALAAVSMPKVVSVAATHMRNRVAMAAIYMPNVVAVTALYVFSVVAVAAIYMPNVVAVTACPSSGLGGLVSQVVIICWTCC